MPSNTSSIVLQVQQEIQSLISYVTGPETSKATVSQVELTLFRRLLALGAQLLQLFDPRRPTPCRHKLKAKLTHRPRQRLFWCAS